MNKASNVRNEQHKIINKLVSTVYATAVQLDEKSLVKKWSTLQTKRKTNTKFMNMTTCCNKMRSINTSVRFSISICDRFIFFYSLCSSFHLKYFVIMSGHDNLLMLPAFNIFYMKVRFSMNFTLVFFLSGFFVCETICLFKFGSRYKFRFRSIYSHMHMVRVTGKWKNFGKSVEEILSIFHNLMWDKHSGNILPISAFHIYYNYIYYIFYPLVTEYCTHISMIRAEYKRMFKRNKSNMSTVSREKLD